MKNSKTAVDAWSQAVLDYTDSLSPSQQLKIRAPATSDDCVRILKEHRSRKKAFTRILQIFEPFIHTLKRLEGAIDVVVQVNAGIASPVWGPVRLAVDFASEHFNTLEQLTLVIDKVVCSIKRYDDLVTIFEAHPEVRTAVGALYSDLVCFCCRVVQFHSRKLRHVFVSFDKEFLSISKAIDLHSTEAHRAAFVAHVKDGKAAQAQIQSTKQADRLHQLHRWLCPSPVEDDLRAHLSEHRVGSSDWFLMSNEFKSFLNGQTENLLRVVARPGSGKSTLAAFLIDHLTNARKQQVLYFFCDSNHSEKRQSIVVMRTLIAQLLKLDPTIKSLIQPLFQQSGRAIADSEVVVGQMFGAVLRKQQEQVIYIVVDALDECTEGESCNTFLQFLRHQIANTRVRLLVTSRKVVPSPDASPTPELTMDAQLCSSSIQDYVADRVQQFRPIAKTDFANDVIREITKNADGLWLYARLMTDEICRAPSRERIGIYLKSLPNGLFELYSQILRSNEEKMTPDEREFAKQLYSWLAVSDYMPSFWAEKFDRLPFRMLQLVFRYVNGGSEVFDAAALARKIGSPLLRLQDYDSTQELDFVHQTAYSFLAKSAELPQDQLPVTIQPQRLNKLHRAVMAVWYFTECADSKTQLAMLQDSDRLDDFFGSDAIGCYFEMAYGLLDAFSLTHLPEDLSNKEKNEVVSMSQKLIFFIKSGAILRYYEMSTIINYSGNFAQLRDNVVNALRKTQSKCEEKAHIPTFEKFRRLGSEFFQAWLAILDKTTPWSAGTPRLHGRLSRSDENLYPTNWVTEKMWMLGKRNGEIFFGKPKTRGELTSLQKGSDSKSRGTRQKWVVCPACQRVVDDKGQLDKHAAFACPGTGVGAKRARRSRKWW